MSAPAAMAAAAPPRRLRDYPGVVFIGLWTGVLNACATGVLSPALPSIARDLGGGADGAFVAQMIQTVSALGMIAGAACAGMASERLGRRKVMLAAVLLYLVSGTAGLWLGSVRELIAARALTGLASGVTMTTSYAIAGSRFEGLLRHRIIGYCGGAGAFATILLLTLAGWMVDRFGWRSVFALHALALPMLLVLWLALDRDRPHPRESREARGWGPILALWPIWLMQAAFAIGVYMSVIQVPFIATDKGIGDASTIGMLVAATSVSGTAVAVGFGRLRRWLGEWGIFALIAGSFALGMGLSVSATTVPAFLTGTVTLGVGAGLLEPAIMSRVLDRIEPALYDRAAGVAISTLFLGQFLNPLVVHPLATVGGIGFAVTLFGWGYFAAFLACAVAMALRRR